MQSPKRVCAKTEKGQVSFPGPRERRLDAGCQCRLLERTLSPEQAAKQEADPTPFDVLHNRPEDCNTRRLRSSGSMPQWGCDSTKRLECILASLERRSC